MERPKITEVKKEMEAVYPIDHFGYEKAPDAVEANSVVSTPYDYTNQLGFHQRILVERQDMPQCQKDFHLGRIALLESLMAE